MFLLLLSGGVVLKQQCTWLRTFAAVNFLTDMSHAICTSFMGEQKEKKWAFMLYLILKPSPT